MKYDSSLFPFGRRIRVASAAALLGLASLLNPAYAQDTPAIGQVSLSEVSISPAAVDTKEWLLLNPDIQVELEGAVQNIYNFKFDKAERQFRSLRRRYPNHPMPDFLLGLSTWWKLMPAISESKIHDKQFYAYMDTAITKAERLYQADNDNYEASFFLAAAYGFDARLNAERRNWTRATLSSKRSLSYLQKSRQANGLSPEFLFGESLFNYYAVWIGETYSWLKPVLMFFPKGNRETGLAQLNSVAQNGFYTGPEARYFQMRILASERENDNAQALLKARSLSKDFPDNACFARTYAVSSFSEGKFEECARISRDILDKLNQGYVGYEGNSGRVATYFLGYLQQQQGKDLSKAQDYYRRCIVFSQSVGKTKGGYYLFSLANLGRIAERRRQVEEARGYFAQVLTLAERKSDMYKEALAFMQENPAAGTSRSRTGRGNSGGNSGGSRAPAFVQNK